MKARNWMLLIVLTLPVVGLLPLVRGDVIPQVSVPVGGSLVGTNDWTLPQRFADGSAAVPSIAWTSDADGTGTGFYRRSTGEIDVTTNGVGAIGFGAASSLGGIHISGSSPGVGLLGWSAGIGATIDLLLGREAAAIVQLGSDVNGAAITQTIKAADGITGTDIIGSGLTLGPGRGTGAGVSQPLVLQRSLRNATGTTAQVLTPAYAACPSKILSNTSATVQAIATITTTTTSAGAIKVFFTSVASNGTLLDADAGEIYVAWNNNAGTVSATASATVGSANSVASGTLTTLPTVTVATNVVTVNFTPTWTVIVPTTVTGFATFEVNGVNTVACQ